jgi:hypothetical protein
MLRIRGRVTEHLGENFYKRLPNFWGARFFHLLATWPDIKSAS